MRLHRSQITAFFFTLPRHTLQIIAAVHSLSRVKPQIKWLLTLPKNGLHKGMVSRRERRVIGERCYGSKGDTLLWNTWRLSCRRLQWWRFLDRRVNVGKYLGNVRFLKVGTDAAEERNTILRTEFLVDRSVMPLALQASRLTLSASQFIFSHGCSQSLSASGRCRGSLWKHCCKKS